MRSLKLARGPTSYSNPSIRPSLRTVTARRHDPKQASITVFKPETVNAKVHF